MTEETENLLLELLRRTRASQERTELELGDIKLRMSATEQNVAQLALQVAGLNSRMDRFDERLARIERRLDLVEA